MALEVIGSYGAVTGNDAEVEVGVRATELVATATENIDLDIDVASCSDDLDELVDNGYLVLCMFLGPLYVAVDAVQHAGIRTGRNAFVRSRLGHEVGWNSCASARVRVST